MKALLLPAALGAGAMAAALDLALQPPEFSPVAALFPPWWSAAQSVAAAASLGLIVRFGAFPFIVIVAPDGAAPVERLWGAGAWLVLNPQALGGRAHVTSNREGHP